MGRLAEKTASQKHLLNIFCTAGYPRIDSIMDVLTGLQEAGAHIAEIGIPYSDPLADGPVIQQSNQVALSNGMTIETLFSQLRHLRKAVSIPVVLMGYLNPVLRYGFERFCADASSCGIDGLIIPDLPPHEFDKEYGSIMKKNGLDFIFLVTPETNDERVKQLDERSRGFLYAVSSSSTTGGQNSIDPAKYIQRLKSLGLRNPLLLGFGISNRDDFQHACEFADGAIIGSAFIKALAASTDVKATTKSFVSSIIGQ